MSREKRWASQEKNPAPEKSGVYQKIESILPSSSLGCLKRIKLCLFFTGTPGNMRSNVAITGFPLQRRLGTSGTKPPGRKFSAAIAAITFFHDFMANPAVVGAPFSSHKRAIKTFSNRCTFHRNHPLSIGFEILNDEFINFRVQQF
jgi:hypothetical protein